MLQPSEINFGQKTKSGDITVFDEAYTMKTIKCTNCKHEYDSALDKCPQCGLKTWQQSKVLQIGTFVIVLILGIFGLEAAFSTSDKKEDTPIKPQSESGEPVKPVYQPPPAETLAEQISRTIPAMTDEVNALSTGATVLAMWSADRLKWSELKNLPRTSRAKVMKDSDEERGKLICASGRIIEISVERVNGRKFSTGGLMDDNGSVYRFVNVGSSGEIVERSYATTCGVVIGRFDYTNSMNGVAHSVQLVGMFDLPENKSPKY